MSLPTSHSSITITSITSTIIISVGITVAVVIKVGDSVVSGMWLRIGTRWSFVMQLTPTLRKVVVDWPWT